MNKCLNGWSDGWDMINCNMKTEVYSSLFILILSINGDIMFIFDIYMTNHYADEGSYQLAFSVESIIGFVVSVYTTIAVSEAWIY